MFPEDPRIYPSAALAPPEFSSAYATAEASLAAETAPESAAHDARLRAAITGWLEPGQGPVLARLFALAPSVAVYRHLWRLLVECERAPPPGEGVAVTLFALPVVIVAACDGAVEGPVSIPAVLPDVPALAAILRENGALAGNRSFALGGVLVATDALELQCLPELLAWRELPAGALPVRSLVPAPMTVAGRHEGAHLRFIVGSALAAPGADPLRETKVGRWGMPLAQALALQLQHPGVTLLALPLAAQGLTTALAAGRSAWREVAARLFASNAIRKFRASLGEPSAVVSVHRVDDAQNSAEVRLSLSSPFDPREAEGFCYPLAPSDRVEDIVKLLSDLMLDCRVADMRREPGVHADRDPATGLTLLFKTGKSSPRALH